MGRASKTQWDFGELFAPAETRRVLTVAEITAQVRLLLESHYASLWVTGEVSNLRFQPSGHCYFTLKDADAQLACVMFRGSDGDRSLLAEGRKVNLRGALTVYEARGQYQLRVDAVEAVGVGALQAAFEKLKQKLAAEGLFAAERKRLLPPFPERIGIVTSATGAALQDVLHVIERRFAGLEVVLAPCRVQGDGAAAEIAAAVRLLNEYSSAAETPLDLILVTRGGGSLEDLWAFNEESVARAIHTSQLPVISGLGHEIDFTIADFAADVRAATPSAAAELITAEYVACRDWVDDSSRILARLVLEQLERKGEKLEGLRHRLEQCRPRRRLEQVGQRLDELQSRLERAARLALRDRQQKVGQLQGRIRGVRPRLTIEALRERVDHAGLRLFETARGCLKSNHARMENAGVRLRLLGPQNALDRGYSITTTPDGRIVRSKIGVRHGDKLLTRLRDGTVRSSVEE